MNTSEKSWYPYSKTCHLLLVKLQYFHFIEGTNVGQKVSSMAEIKPYSIFLTLFNTPAYYVYPYRGTWRIVHRGKKHVSDVQNPYHLLRWTIIYRTDVCSGLLSVQMAVASED